MRKLLLSANATSNTIFFVLNLTLLLPNTTCPVLANSLDPDQLASNLDLHCLSLNL